MWNRCIIITRLTKADRLFLKEKNNAQMRLYTPNALPVLSSQLLCVPCLLLQIYVEYVIKNPMCPLGETITSELFKTKLDEYVRGLPIFATKLS